MTLRRHRIVRLAGAGLTAVMTAVGCGAGESARTSSGTPEITRSAPSHSRTMAPARPPTREAKSCLDRTLEAMALPERVGQLFMGPVPVGHDTAAVPDSLGTSHAGSFLLIGQATGGRKQVATAVRRAREVAGTPAGVEPIVAADQEGGAVQRLKGPGFQTIPSASTQAEMTSTSHRRHAQSWGRDLRKAGVNLNLAPVADVVPATVGAANEPVGALGRGYGADRSAVSGHASAFVAGMSQAGVSTTVKHFPGLGKVHGNTDFTRGVVDRSTTDHDPDLAPFRAGVEAGSDFLMVSLATYLKIDPRHRAVFSPKVIDGMVRDDMGFDGVVLSDDLGAAAEVSDVPPAERAVRFLRAGGDIVVTASGSALSAMTRGVIAEARSDAAFRSVVDERVRRVLTVKQRMGLLTCR